MKKGGGLVALVTHQCWFVSNIIYSIQNLSIKRVIRHLIARSLAGVSLNSGEAELFYIHLN